MIKFVIPGDPVGKGRPIFATRGKYHFAYTPERTKIYEQKVKDCFGDNVLTSGPIAVKIEAIYKVPASASKKKKAELLKSYPVKKPDLDNVVKIVLDALNTIAYKDDSQIVMISAVRKYGNEPQVIVEIIPIDYLP